MSLATLNEALVWEDRRNDYGERRYCVLGFIEDRLHSVVFTPRNGKLRVISLRKGNKREVNRYEKVVKTWKKDPQDKSGVDNSHDC